MWLTLATTTEVELEASSEAVKASYEKLNVATLELQKRVKELLCDYPDDSADGTGQLSAEQHAGGEAEAVGQAARLLGRLCAQPARVEEGSAPGAIFTPRGNPNALSAVDKDTSGPTGPRRLKPFLLTDVPSLRWEKAAVPGAGRLRQPAGGRGGNSQRLIPNLRVVVDLGALEDTHEGLLHEDCDHLRAEALAELRELHSDASPTDMHRRLLREAVEYDSLPPRDRMFWTKLHPQEGVVARTRQLLVVLVHTSKSSAEAWACVTQALMHGLAHPDGEAVRLLGPLRDPVPNGVGEFFVTPASYPNYVIELRQELDQWLQEVLQQQTDEAKMGGQLSEKDLLAYKHSITPSTYLQMVGQKLLYHATLQLPCMAELPERVPDWTLRTLYGRPFAEAVRLALQHVMTAATKPIGPNSTKADDQMRGGAKQPGFQLLSRDDPRRRGAQQKQPRGSREGGPAQQAVGDTCGTTATSGATEDAVEQACCAVGLIADTFRDVAAFEKGFGDVLRGDVPRRPQPEALTEPLPSVAAQAAAAYQLVVREEVARVARELRVALRNFINSHVVSAVQACLSAEDLRQPPHTVAVSPDDWPAAEPTEPSRPVGLQVQTQAATCTTSNRAGGGELEGRSVPPLIDAGSHRVLQFASWLLGRLDLFPEALQAVLAGATLECLSLLMDRLALVCTTLREMPGSSSSPLLLALLFHSAACCVRRRLERFQWALEIGVQDEQYLALMQQYGECLVQADELVSSIQRHIVMAYTGVVQTVILTCVDRTDWSAYRPEVMRGQSVGPAVRVWHGMLLRMLHSAATYASLHAAEWMVGQVLQEGMGSLAQRYLQLCPSVQMLREFVADAVHVVSTVFLLCQPMPLVQAPQRQGADKEDRQQRAGTLAAAAAPAAQVTTRWLRLPHPMVRALARTARELLTRAALLHVTGSKLEQVARQVGLLTQSPGSGTVTPPVAVAPPDLGRTSAGGGGGAVRLEPLPAIHVLRASLSVEAAGAVAEGEEPAPTSSDTAPAVLGFPRSISGGLLHGATADPRAANVPGSGSGFGPGADIAAEDEERLAMWSCWLPGQVIRALTDEAEAISIRCSLDAAHCMPLGDRMAEEKPGEALRQGHKADGRMWRLSLERLANLASKEQVLLALGRRHELHAAVGTEPAGNAESRRIVRVMARQLGLLDDPAD